MRGAQPLQYPPHDICLNERVGNRGSTAKDHHRERVGRTSASGGLNWREGDGSSVLRSDGDAGTGRGGADGDVDAGGGGDGRADGRRFWRRSR